MNDEYLLYAQYLPDIYKAIMNNVRLLYGQYLSDASKLAIIMFNAATSTSGFVNTLPTVLTMIKDATSAGSLVNTLLTVLIVFNSATSAGGSVKTLCQFITKIRMDYYYSEQTPTVSHHFEQTISKAYSIVQTLTCVRPIAEDKKDSVVGCSIPNT